MVPVMGAFLIDLANALVIQGFLILPGLRNENPGPPTSCPFRSASFLSSPSFRQEREAAEARPAS